MTSRISLTAVVADDQPLSRAGLTRALDEHTSFTLTGVTGDGREALDMIRDRRPDVAIVAMDLPHLDGLGVLETATLEGLTAGIVLLGTRYADPDVRRAIVLGARGVLTRHAETGEVLDALLAAARGNQVLDPRIGEVGRDGRFARDDGTRPLTAREQEVLHLMAEGMSGPQIAKQLVVSPSTVKSHIENLYEKLGVSHRGAAVAEGMRRGLLR